VYDAPTISAVNTVYTTINYGSYTYNVINASVNDAAWGSYYVNWTSIWNAGSRLDPNFVALLQGSGALNSVSSELRAAILNNRDYFTRSEWWSKTTDPWSAVDGCRASLWGRGYTSAASSHPSAQTIKVDSKDQTPYSTSYSDPVVTGSYVVDTTGEESVLHIKQTHYTQARTKTDYYYEKTGTVSVNTYDITGTIWASPIVLNLKGDGKLVASRGRYSPHSNPDIKSMRLFDFFGCGFPVLVEWVGPEEGLLCVPGEEGSIDGTNLFGTAGGYVDGFVKLSTYDGNGDKKTTGKELDGICVWVDSNSNARADKGEVYTCKELGITQLNLDQTNKVSSFIQNGKSKIMWDWYPVILEAEKVE
jgi:hypothetical protein